MYVVSAFWPLRSYMFDIIINTMELQYDIKRYFAYLRYFTYACTHTNIKYHVLCFCCLIFFYHLYFISSREIKIVWHISCWSRSKKWILHELRTLKNNQSLSQQTKRSWRRSNGREFLINLHTLKRLIGQGYLVESDFKAEVRLARLFKMAEGHVKTENYHGAVLYFLVYTFFSSLI
jgi:hypothetical protein